MFFNYLNLEVLFFKTNTDKQKLEYLYQIIKFQPLVNISQIYFNNNKQKKDINIADKGMAQRIIQIFTSVSQNIDDDLQGFTPLKNICDKYKIKPSWIFLPVVLLVILSTFIGLCQHLFVTLFGMLYPAYMSFKAINKNSQQESKQWLTYWIIFGFLTAFDTMLSFVLFFLPAYYTFKVLFYLWLFYPRTNGAHILYDKLLRPQLKKLKTLAQKYHVQ